jgi:MFS family permease
MNRTEQDDRVITVVVACLATAMLMLDISVINTALSEIAHGLDTGLGGLQWVVNAYTIPLAATVLTAGAVAADRIGAGGCSSWASRSSPPARPYAARPAGSRCWWPHGRCRGSGHR